MLAPFEDKYPGAPRLLFIGLPHSTHTHSWIRLLDNRNINVRVFGVALAESHWAGMMAMMPNDWAIPTYLGTRFEFQRAYEVDSTWYFPGSIAYWEKQRPKILAKNMLRRLLRHKPSGIPTAPQHLLNRVIAQWQPDIVHTLGLEPAGYFFHSFRPASFNGKWVAQLRGGSDLTPAYKNPDLRDKPLAVCKAADYVIVDNHWNIQYLQNNGVPQIAPIAPVPGAGGINLEQFKPNKPPSKRRILLYPKAYTSDYTQAMPVFEALRLCAAFLVEHQIEVKIFNALDAGALWKDAMLSELGDLLEFHKDGLPHDKMIQLMQQSRVMLSPSLVDGVPNVLYEAMATGAVPIVSPLETITPIVKDHENVMFARNLYPQEIADRITEAFTDDALVDSIATANSKRVRELADRSVIREQVFSFYTSIVD